MTMPGRLLDFFVLESSEYLTRLESLAAKETMGPSDAAQFAAAARSLRGSATMAKAGEIVRVAMMVERIGSRVVNGATKWDPALQRALVGAIEDLKLLVRSVRTWGADQDARVEDCLRRLARFAPPLTERMEDLIIPISQLFYNDDGQHIIYVAPNAKTHYEQQLRDQSGGIGPGTLSPEVTRVPTPSREVPPAQPRTPPRGQELRDVLTSSLETMRALASRQSGLEPSEIDIIPIQDLLYRGQSAIARAAEIRRALKKSGAPPTRSGGR